MTSFAYKLVRGSVQELESASPTLVHLAEAIARTLAEQPDPPGFRLAAIHLALGSTSQALTWLERAYAARDDELVYLRIDETFEPLRVHRAFQDLVRRIGIPISAGLRTTASVALARIRLLRSLWTAAHA